MAIPNAITAFKSGIPGTLSHAGPTRALSAIFDSASAANNVFGRAFTHKSVANSTVQAGGSGSFAGIATNPHAYAINQSTAANGGTGEFVHMGEIFVKLVPAVASGKTPVTAAVGSKVYFVVATGELTCDPTNQDTVPVAHTEIKGAAVVRHAPATASGGGQLAIISLTGFQA